MSTEVVIVFLTFVHARELVSVNGGEGFTQECSVRMVRVRVCVPVTPHTVLEQTLQDDQSLAVHTGAMSQAPVLLLFVHPCSHSHVESCTTAMIGEY